MEHKRKETIYADDATEKVSLLLELRLPWLFGGLIVGAMLTFAVAKFENLLAADLRLAFFMPVIVYMSAAIGNQTQTIFVRNLAKGHPKFSVYLIKEIVLGLLLGVILGSALGLFTAIWLKSAELALTVGLAMFASSATATVVGLLTPMVLRAEHTDPAVGAGPVTSALQDIITIFIYFAVASTIIL